MCSWVPNRDGKKDFYSHSPRFSSSSMNMSQQLGLLKLERDVRLQPKPTWSDWWWSSCLPECLTDQTILESSGFSHYNTSMTNQLLSSLPHPIHFWLTCWCFNRWIYTYYIFVEITCNSVEGIEALQPFGDFLQREATCDLKIKHYLNCNQT